MELIRTFVWRNAWYKHPDGYIAQYNTDVYATKSESLNDRPEKWENSFKVFYIGNDLEYDKDIFDDPSEVFLKYKDYMLKKGSEIFYSKGKFHIGIRIDGTEGLYYPNHFTTIAPKEEFDTENPGILLKDPPSEVPDYWSKEYKLLYKEHGGNINDAFEYVDYIKVTRKPEEYPEWLTKMLNAPSKAKLRKK